MDNLVLSKLKFILNPSNMASGDSQTYPWIEVPLSENLNEGVSLQEVVVYS